jgi:SAM-dependent methyltransferase
MNMLTGNREKVKYKHTSLEKVDRSAEIVVPVLLRMIDAKSVVDIGCGIGNWLKAFSENNVRDIFGIDGAHLNPADFKLSEDVLMRVDLEKPFRLDRKFDLAISIEVAEHISPQNARNFVESICKLSDTVVFSGAAPGQGGQNHLNEQHPSYWIEIFRSNGFDFEDAIRPLIWNEKEVQTWYKQNMLLFRRSQGEIPTGSRGITDMLHPELLRSKMIEVEEGAFGINFALKSLINAIRMRWTGRGH